MFEGGVYPSPEFLDDPFPFYRWLRDHAPVYEVPGRGEFLVSRHADVRAVLGEPELFSSAFSRQPEKVGRPADVLESDPPGHARQKQLVMTGLKPGRVRAHADAITEVVETLLARVAAARELAFVADLAAPLPVHVFATMFGLDADELWRIHSSSTYVGPARRYLPESERASDVRRAFEMFDYLGRELRQRVDEPREDLLTEMIERQASQDGGLDLPYLQSEIDILFIGGLTTTPHLLVNSLRLLLEHPAAMERARHDPKVLPRVLDETLRLESPVQWQPRLVTSDTELHGVRLPAGSRVLVVIGAANRDERVFSDPDRFDIDRADLKEHLALGQGTHFCAGASLARTESRIALEGLLRTFDGLGIAERNDFAPYPGLSARSVQELHLDVEPAGRRDH